MQHTQLRGNGRNVRSFGGLLRSDSIECLPLAANIFVVLPVGFLVLSALKRVISGATEQKMKGIVKWQSWLEHKSRWKARFRYSYRLYYGIDHRKFHMSVAYPYMRQGRTSTTAMFTNLPNADGKTTSLSMRCKVKDLHNILRRDKPHTRAMVACLGFCVYRNRDTHGVHCDWW